MLKYVNTGIVFQEIPDEVTLAINISGCPCRCPGCHSRYLWEDIGKPLDAAAIDHCISTAAGDITCVAFMGGDADPEEVAKWAQYVRPLKTAWYSGRMHMPQDEKAFDYVKLGPYIESLGGLKSEKTNQRFYKRKDDTWIDITSVFWKKNLAN